MANFQQALVDQTHSSGTETAANGDVNKALVGITASLSILGTIAIISSYVLWKDVRTSSRQILVYISIADFFTALGNLLGLLVHWKGGNDDLCVGQSFLTTCSSLWSFFWSAFLAVFLYVSVAKGQPNVAKRMMSVFILFGWVVPLLITSIAAHWQVLGPDKDKESAGWCWIKSDANNKLAWLLATGKAWEIAAYIVIVAFYAMLKCHVKKQMTHRYSELCSTGRLKFTQRADSKMTLIPIIFVLLRMWGTIRFFLAYSPSDPSFLVYLHAIGDSGQGFANFMLFCVFTEKFQKRMVRMLCCCKRDAVYHTGTETGDSNKTEPEPQINEAIYAIATQNAKNDLENSLATHPP